VTIGAPVSLVAAGELVVVAACDCVVLLLLLPQAASATANAQSAATPSSDFDHCGPNPTRNLMQCSPR
jgi:hypothetical protein